MPDTPDRTDAEQTPPEPGARRGISEDDIERIASQGASALNRFVRRAAKSARAAAEAARPEAERLARQARDAAEAARPEAERLARQARDAAEAAARAARPRVERAAREARQYLEEHDEELRRAGRVGAHYIVARSIPVPIRPLVDAMGREISRPRAPLRAPEPDIHGTPEAEAPEPPSGTAPPRSP
jgi:multidrug efflux pump subunit AcrA (membrane-fusion protein)